MGTRHFVSIIHDGKQKICQYGQWDGYPTHTGIAVLEFVRDADKKQLIAALENTYITKTPYDDACSYTGSNKNSSELYRKVFLKENQLQESEGKWFEFYETTMLMIKNSELSVAEADILLPSSRDTGVDILSYIYNRDLSLSPLELYALTEEYDEVANFAARECAKDVPGLDAQGYYVIDLDKNAVFMNFNDVAWQCCMDNLPQDIERSMALFEVRSLHRHAPENIKEYLNDIREHLESMSISIELTHEEIADLIAFGIERFPSLKENKVKAPLESKIEFASNRTVQAQSTDIAAVKTSVER